MGAKSGNSSQGEVVQEQTWSWLFSACYPQRVSQAHRLQVQTIEITCKIYRI